MIKSLIGQLFFYLKTEKIWPKNQNFDKIDFSGLFDSIINQNRLEIESERVLKSWVSLLLLSLLLLPLLSLLLLPWLLQLLSLPPLPSSPISVPLLVLLL